MADGVLCCAMIGGFFMNGVILSLSWREVIVVYIGSVVLDA